MLAVRGLPFGRGTVLVQPRLLRERRDESTRVVDPEQSVRGRSTEVGVDQEHTFAGLREGDTILEVNRASVSSVADFDRAMRNVSNGATLLLVKRGDNTFYIAVQAK